MAIPPSIKNANPRAAAEPSNEASAQTREVGLADARPADATAADRDVLTVEEAAAFLKVGRNTLYDACARNKVPYRRVGRQIRLSRTALVAWLGSWSKQDAQKGQ